MNHGHYYKNFFELLWFSPFHLENFTKNRLIKDTSQKIESEFKKSIVLELSEEPKYQMDIHQKNIL